MRIRSVKPAFMHRLDGVLDKMHERRGQELLEIEKMVSSDLLDKPDLLTLVSERIEYFIRWAAYYRLVGFKSGITSEVKDFIEDSLHLSDAYVRPPTYVWEQLRKQVFKRDNNTCSYCGEQSLKLECDHIIPISKGGGNSLNNLTTACNDCNRCKSNKSVEQFLLWRAGK